MTKLSVFLILLISCLSISFAIADELDSNNSTNITALQELSAPDAFNPTGNTTDIAQNLTNSTVLNSSNTTIGNPTNQSNPNSVNATGSPNNTSNSTTNFRPLASAQSATSSETSEASSDVDPAAPLTGVEVEVATEGCRIVRNCGVIFRPGVGNIPHCTNQLVCS